MDWSDGFKPQVRYADESFVEMEGLTWKPPRYKQPDTLLWIPLVEEIAQLISACGKKGSVFLQGLKKTEPRSIGRESKVGKPKN